MTISLLPAGEAALQSGGAVVDGRYRLLNVIRTTRIGDVWAAVDERLDRRVALHRIAVSDGAGSRERFERRVEALARVNHPGVVRLFDANPQARWDGVRPTVERYGPILVCECADGPTLAQRLSSGPLNADLTLALAAGLTNALSYLRASHIRVATLSPDDVIMGVTGDQPPAKLSADVIVGAGPRHGQDDAREDVQALAGLLRQAWDGAPQDSRWTELVTKLAGLSA